MKIHTSLSVVIRLFLWLVMMIGGAIYSLAKDWNAVLFNSAWFHLLSAGTGGILLMLAFRAAANGGRELSKGRVGDIPRMETNRLVTTGLYSCMRHPMLFGLTLLPLGWAFLLGSPTFMTLVAPLEMLFIVLMVIIFEEREADSKFGEAYETYRQQVPMVSFQWHCLKRLFKKR